MRETGVPALSANDAHHAKSEYPRMNLYISHRTKW